jgi:UDP-N-acetylglucosamine acyltransferase
MRIVLLPPDIPVFNSASQMSLIHPTATIDARATLDPSVQVGPYVVIDAHVTVGPGCRIGPHVHLTGHTTIGANNLFHSGAVIGDAPQDLKYDGAPTRLVIGDNNVFREHTTVHRSNKLADATHIGHSNFLMANSHIGHNTILGDHNIIANGALIAGHVTVMDRAFISGNCLVHQFVRVGTLALMQGGSAISKDLPPFAIARGDNRICGLNIIGLRRAGFTPEQRLELKRLYHLLFRRGNQLRAAVDEASITFQSPAAQQLLDFVKATRRGVCTDGSRRPDSPEEND